MSGSASRQLLLTLGLGLGLSGLCWAYASVLNPMLVPNQTPPLPDPAQLLQPPISGPRENVEIAQRFLQSQPWASKAEKMFATETTYLYTETVTPIDNDRAVDLSPFALVWFPKGTQGGDGPITIVCARARILFASRISVASFQPGRPVQASLEGGVRIEGPDGLFIEGQSFVFDDEPMHVRCDHPVNFRYRRNHGSARSLQIELQADADLRRQQKFAVTGVKSFMLRSEVRMELESEDEDDPVHVQIQSAGPFEYVLADQRATFEREIWVYRPTGPNQFDSLHCDWLSLAFENATEAESSSDDEGFQGLGGRLSLRELRAEGNNVVLESQDNDLKVTNVREMVYDLPSKTVSLGSKASTVKARMQSTLLKCPEIQLVHDDDGQMVSAVCRGPGQLDNYDKETNQPVISAGWERELYKHPDPEGTGLQVIELTKQAYIRQHGAAAGLGAESIKLWYLELPDEQRQGKGDSGRFRPIRLRAHDQVALVSEQMYAETSDLEVQFREGSALRQASANASNPFGSRIETTSSDDANSDPSADPLATPEEPLNVAADRIVVQVSQQGDLDQSHVDEIFTFGRVVVTQPNPNPAESLELKGESLNLKNQSDREQIVELRGEPAIVATGEVKIEARQISFDRGRNLAAVKGRGVLTLPVKRSLQGEELPEPQLLDIWWNEKMSFDGQTAEFYGDVDAKLEGSSLRCQEMKVELTERISFAGDAASQRDGIEVHRVFCRDGVEISNDRYEGSKLKEVFRGHFWEFSLDQLTGKTEVRGKGWINVWRRTDDNRAPLGSGANGRANRPLQLQKTDWMYIRTEFDGTAVGNLEQNDLKFQDGVRILYGGVAHPQGTVDRDRLPLNAGWLKSRTLTFQRHEETEDQDGFFQLVAGDNAWMEGRTKDGIFWAQADQISYDESKETFILRSHRGQLAHIWREKIGGGERDHASGRRIEFRPSINSVKIDDSPGLQGQP